MEVIHSLLIFLLTNLVNIASSTINLVDITFQTVLS